MQSHAIGTLTLSMALASLAAEVATQSKLPPAAGRRPTGRTTASESSSGFGHYLQNEPARAWITSGVSVLEREQELKRASKKGQPGLCAVQ